MVMNTIQFKIELFQKSFEYCWCRVYFDQTTKYKVDSIFGIMLDWKVVLANDGKNQLDLVLFDKDVLFLEDSQDLRDKVE